MTQSEINNIIELLLSPDPENRRLGLSYIKNNYILPLILYYTYNNGEYKFQFYRNESFYAGYLKVELFLSNPIRYQPWTPTCDLRKLLESLLKYISKEEKD